MLDRRKFFYYQPRRYSFAMFYVVYCLNMGFIGAIFGIETRLGTDQHPRDLKCFFSINKRSLSSDRAASRQCDLATTCQPVSESAMMICGCCEVLP